MQKRELQKNAQAKAPAKLNAGAMPSEKPPLSEEKQKQLNGMLLDAAENGKTKRAERLLKVGASIEAKDNYGWTALMHAAREGYTDVCMLLVEKGASIEAKDNYGWTALMHAAWNGHTQTCALLLGKGASIEAKDNDGWTPLMWAAWNGRTPTCALLLSKGADVNAKAGKGDWKGMTASSIAEKGNKKKTAAFLKTMEWLAGITGNAFMKPFAECIAG